MVAARSVVFFFKLHVLFKKSPSLFSIPEEVKIHIILVCANKCLIMKLICELCFFNISFSL